MPSPFRGMDPYLEISGARRIAPDPASEREVTALPRRGKSVRHNHLGRIPFQIIGCAQFAASYP
jgi:hypothetical protein